MLNSTTHKIDIIMTTCPKPFIEPFIDIQSNAIDSWKALDNILPNVSTHIYLIGDEENIASASQLLNVHHIPSIKRNKFGTPLVSDLFKTTQSIEIENSSIVSEIVYCFVNTDIVLMPNFVHTINAFIHGRLSGAFNEWSTKKYLMVGQRIDIDRLPRIFNFSNLQQSYDDIFLELERHNQLHSPEGMDYFIFSKNTFPFVYDFAIGKLVWDAWLTGNAYRRGLFTIDATNTITAIHQAGDWYQASNDPENRLVNTREKLEESEEVLINQSFDYYEKNTKSGTTWKIDFDEQQSTFLFKKKKIIPDED